MEFSSFFSLLRHLIDSKKKTRWQLIQWETSANFSKCICIIVITQQVGEKQAKWTKKLINQHLAFQAVSIEAVTQNCSLKGVFLKMLKILLVSLFLIKLQTPGCNFNKNETQEHVFFYQFYQIFKNTSFVENLQRAASVTRYGS